MTKKRAWMSDVRCLSEADKDLNAEEETRTDSLSSVKRAQCINHSVRTHTHTHTCKDDSLASKWMNGANSSVCVRVCYSEIFWHCSLSPSHRRAECLSSTLKPHGVIMCVCDPRKKKCPAMLCMCELRFKCIRNGSSTNEILHQHPVERGRALRLQPLSAITH